MDVVTLNIRKDVLDREEFREEFREIWDTVVREQLNQPAASEISPQFLAAVRGKPSSEIVKFRFVGAGLTGFEQVLITHVLEPAFHAGVAFVITEVLRRIVAGRPPDAVAVKAADPPAAPGQNT